MDIEILKVVGKVAGIGGLGLGVFLILFREVIRKNIFPNLDKKRAYKLLMAIIACVWSLAVIAIISWLFIELRS